MNLSTFIIFVQSLSWSNDMTFFKDDKKIEYWKNKNNTTTKKEALSPKWSKYLNPQHDDFFKEGNHIPPEPFMELARNPTDENIKNWFDLLDAKNKLMKRLQESIQSYLEKNGSKYKSQEKQLVEQELKKLTPIKVLDGDIRRFRFQLYVDSKCHFCKSMLETMKEFMSWGYYVEIKQIDKEPLGPLPFVLTYASAQEVKQKQLTSWPVLFIADTKKEKIYRINGFKTSQEIISKLSTKEIL